MIKATVGDALIVGGRITSIKTIDAGKILITIDHDKKVEFRNNGKKNRADIVKRLDLKKDDRILVSAGKSKADPSYLYGWDIFLQGSVSVKNASLLTGCISRIIHGVKDDVLIMESDGRENAIKIHKTKKTLKEGDETTVLCFCYRKKNCAKTCKGGDLFQCILCSKQNMAKRYVGIVSEI